MNILSYTILQHDTVKLYAQLYQQNMENSAVVHRTGELVFILVQRKAILKNAPATA